MSVRLPSGDAYIPQVAKEHRWLPYLAPQLPLPIPTPLARGVPDEEFPRPWSVYRWLDGEPADVDRVTDPELFALDLAGVLVALRGVDATGGPAAGQHSFHRGGSLATYDGETRATIAALGDRVDAGRALSVWRQALEARWRGPPAWVHGDVTPSNLLVLDGRLSAVIDFGCCAVGDPACDLAIAWTFFEGSSRRRFLETIGADEGARRRGRGWALWKALLTVAGSEDGDGADARRRFGWRSSGRAVVEAVLSDTSPA
jgi:aminoglycoside phosphotransferase (APT) family kinase protein